MLTIKRAAMGLRPAKLVFLVAAMMFFAVLALDITWPAVVLSAMALSNWFVLSAGTTQFQRRRGTA
ncbi:hypothetical protein A6U86_03170 [Rhizobium sp. AC27/96]|uniref:hypothetical protein n=1 Tax=Rhizobium rhizogenes TaxID=359 RepID=UPI000828C17E|nr:hypothetical protein [Rhizobium rhizogenes]NTF41683.1 hypothetical protein [Rhizobium rhizogenes]OCJ12066.1 hypothetical protein A6U86_03170 [Rhizobium sp. AC27/96]